MKNIYNSRSGFTLIELLVVIAIISILAAVLFPVFAQSREKARQTTCISNERNIGIAIRSYTQDYDEVYPSGVNLTTPGEGWAGSTFPYLKTARIYACPDDQTVPPAPNTVMSYAMNSNIASGSNSPSEGLLTAPTSTVLAFEVTGVVNVNVAGGGEQTSPTGNGNTVTHNIPNYGTGNMGQPAIINGGIPTHNQIGSHFIATDGHAKFLRGAAVSPGLNATAATSPQTATNAAGTSGLTSSENLTFSIL